MLFLNIHNNHLTAKYSPLGHQACGLLLSLPHRGEPGSEGQRPRHPAAGLLRGQASFYRQLHGTLPLQPLHRPQRRQHSAQDAQ